MWWDMCCSSFLPCQCHDRSAAASDANLTQGTTIEITLWRGVADKFYDHIEEGQVSLNPCHIPSVPLLVTGEQDLQLFENSHPAICNLLSAVHAICSRRE